MTEQGTDAAAAAPSVNPPETVGADPSPAAAPPEPEPDPTPPGLDELLAWLMARTPMIARARIAQAVVKRIEDDVIDPAVVYAWEHRHQQATLRDLSNATGLNMARLTWALRRHPRSDT
jgi:hypothetical protein